MIAHTPPVAKPTRLAQQAITALTNACAAEPADRAFFVEERSVWQPGSWLLQRCWEALADAGAGGEALSVAALIQTRHPLAPVQALHRVAQLVKQRPLLAALVRAELDRQIGANRRFAPTASPDETQLRERLLYAAATAGLVEYLPLACACLERLDQLEKPWERVFARSEWRLLLAESVAHVGLHPLTMALIDNAIRRFDDAGAQFLHEIVTLVAQVGNLRNQRLLLRCVETFRYATLSTLQSRRLAAITLGRAGLVDEVLSQLAFIANVQDARRETGLSAGKDDPLLLRQVKRPAANGDIDFQVYTLQQTINAMPIRQIAREKRIVLADQLAFLGVRSDGWTAAGAAVTLIELGALKYAIEVVDHVAPNDPTRPSGMLELVAGLLAVDEPGMAAEQAQRALAWARGRADRNPERAVTWGLAEIYLDQGEPEKALRWLGQWREPVGLRRPLGARLWARLESLWRKQLDDDTLRLHSLRLRALLQRGGVEGNAAALQAHTKEVQSLVSELRGWAPRLLEGEALVNFYIDSLLRPLLAAARPEARPEGSRLGARSQAWAVLSELVRALSTTSGNKHVMHVAAVATLLAQQLPLAAAPEGGWQRVDGGRPIAEGASGRSPPPATSHQPPADAELRQAVETFLSQLWEADAKRGPWQIIHSIEGSIPLLLALEGPHALVAIAGAANEERRLWSQ